jgi:hypothetical protein
MPNAAPTHPLRIIHPDVRDIVLEAVETRHGDRRTEAAIQDAIRYDSAYAARGTCGNA